MLIESVADKKDLEILVRLVVLEGSPAILTYLKNKTITLVNIIQELKLFLKISKKIFPRKIITYVDLSVLHIISTRSECGRSRRRKNFAPDIKKYFDSTLILIASRLVSAVLHSMFVISWHFLVRSL